MEKSECCFRKTSCVRLNLELTGCLSLLQLLPVVVKITTATTPVKFQTNGETSKLLKTSIHSPFSSLWAGSAEFQDNTANFLMSGWLMLGGFVFTTKLKSSLSWTLG